MINVKDLLTILKKNNINFFTGVPDSVLSQLSAHLDNNKSIENIITGNEGSAVALAVGHFLAKKKNSMCIHAEFRARKCDKSFSFYHSSKSLLDTTFAYNWMERFPIQG